MSGVPIVLVPGFWLGEWAWDEVAGLLRDRGHDVTAVTLPGLASSDDDRTGVSMADHVEAICDAVTAAGERTLLAVHSGAGVPGYGAADRISERIAAMVYVDTGPAVAPLDPDFDGDELPLPPLEQLAEEENLDGLSDDQLARFRDRAVPQPGSALREAPTLTNEARLDVPSTVICTGYTSAQYQDAVAEGQTWLGGLAELRDVTWVDLPTSHWPMWSRPEDLADLLAGIADSAG